MTTKIENSGKKKKSSENEVDKKPQFQISRINEFASDVKNEFGKIVWPAKKQTIGSTAVVVVLVMIISFYLGAVDLLLGKLIGLLIK